jgi:glycosyltransferase involved in cell wall biosynthesis
VQIVSPFGSPTSTVRVEKKTNKTDALRVLFVGSMGQRKGLGDLFEAMHLLNSKNIELIVLGSLLAPMEFYINEYAAFIYEQGRPHDKVLELMRTCDVFCLPSIVEGRALVMQEAMSQGLPIIITPNTGGEDLVMEGETGFLVPIRSPQAIAEKIRWFDEHRDAIPEMGEKARLHAANYTWEQYGKTIVEGILRVKSKEPRVKIKD